MARQEQLERIKQGTDVWNSWREQHPEVQVDLSDADLSNADLSGADLSEANLRGAKLFDTKLFEADLSGADLSDANLSLIKLSKASLYTADLSGANLFGATLFDADLSEADLSGANLSSAGLSNAVLYSAKLSDAKLSRAELSEAFLFEADLSGADLSEADLSGADLSGADLSGANLSGANLSGANLSKTTLIGTNLSNATLKDCTIYGIAVWDVQLNGAKQINLKITPEDQPTITVDNLKIAQFIYLLLDNKEIRDAIDTIAKKAILILGRFGKRKPVLDALRDELRKQNYLPILFDFENPESRDVTETVRTLAHLARFILADLTDPSSIPLELDTIVPLLEVPIQPLLLDTNREFSMFASLTKYDWVLPIHTYKDLSELLASLENLITCAERKVDELTLRKARRLTSQ